MASSHAFLLICILPLVMADVGPCPFSDYCNCTQGVNPTTFENIDCKMTGKFPKFDTPVRAYTATKMRVWYNVAKMEAKSFSAFMFIGELRLEQTDELGSVKADWDNAAFDQVLISSLTIIGLRGILPPSEALKNAAQRNLKELTFSNCEESVELGPDEFSAFTNLQTLAIENTLITNISSAAFSNLENKLEYLTLRNCSLTSIPTVPLMRLIKLASLNLADNPIDRLDIRSMPFLPMLEALDISNTQVDTVDISIFNGMDKFTYLDLDNCGEIKDLDMSSFDLFPPNLATIHVRNSSLEKVHPNVAALLERPEFNVLDISDTHRLICDGNLNWIAKYAVCYHKMVKMDNATCNDGHKLEIYLSTLNPCGSMTTPNPPTTAENNTCPFSADCICAFSQDPLHITVADCKSKLPLMPSFQKPNPNQYYNIDEALIITSNVAELKPLSFAAFRDIRLLILQQEEAPGPNKVNWAFGCFDGDMAGVVPQIRGFSVSGVSGVIPPNPIPAGHAWQEVQTLGTRGLREFSIIKCRENIQLNDGVFKKFPHLTKLELEETSITQIDPNAFADLSATLTELKVGQAKLAVFPKDALAPLTSLVNLDLSYNDMNQFPANAFSAFVSLQSLALTGNNITAAVEQKAFTNFPGTILSLRLDHGQLNAIPTDTLSQMTHVTGLDLSSNQIGKVKSADFKSGLKVITLDLSDNPISEIENGAFKELTEMTTLILEYTPLTSFDFSLLNGAKKFGVISLDHNDKLTTVKVTSIDQVPSTLNQIYLRKSALQTVDISLKPVLDSKDFHYLDIGDSKNIACNESVHWLASYALCQPVHVLMEKTVCSNGTFVKEYLTAAVPNACGTESSTTTTATTTSTGTGSTSTTVSTVSTESTVSTVSTESTLSTASTESTLSTASTTESTTKTTEPSTPSNSTQSTTEGNSTVSSTKPTDKPKAASSVSINIFMLIILAISTVVVKSM